MSHPDTPGRGKPGTLRRVTDAPLSLAHRIWLAFACFFRVLFDGAFARRAAGLAEPTSATPEESTTTVVEKKPLPTKPSPDAALNLLAILQREGRLVDFLEQDIEVFPDADIGAAARVIHAGCRRALRSHFDLSHVREEPEGASVTIGQGEATSIKLTGDVRGSAPYRGVLRHGGWRVTRTTLPELVSGHDVTLICAAEVEL